MSRVADEIQNLLTDGEIVVQEKIELLRLQLDSERLSAERRKFKSEQKFLTKNFAAVLLTAIISLAAVLVSFSQVWVAKIQKEKELSVAQSQKEKETTLLVEQQSRAWKLEAAKFIAEHKGELFGKDRLQKELMRNVILTTFPADISADLFAKLEAVSTSPEEKRVLQAIRKQIIPQIKRTLPDLSMLPQEEIAKTFYFPSNADMKKEVDPTLLLFHELGHSLKPSKQQISRDTSLKGTKPAYLYYPLFSQN